MRNKQFLFVGSRLEVLKIMIRLGLNTTALIYHNTFAARMMKEQCTIFQSKKELLNLIKNSHFDILVSNGCPYILPVKELKKEGQIFVNVHPSLLPKLRGLNSVNGSILFDEPAGATCHIMDDEIDNGDIIAWQEIHNDTNIKLSLLYQLSFLAETKAFEKALQRNFVPHKRQDEKTATYYTRKADDMILHLDTDSDELLLRKVRAFSQKGQMAKYYQQNKCFAIQSAQILYNELLAEFFQAQASNDIVLRYENYILIKREKGFLELCVESENTINSTLKDLKMSKMSMSIDEYFKRCLKPNLSYKDDIYFKKEYAKLYGEVFEFSFCKNGCEFRTIAIKERIGQSEFFDLQSPYGYSGFYSNSKDETFIKEALSELKQRALKENIIAFFLRFHPFDELLPLYQKHLQFFADERKIVIVATAGDLARIRANYSSRIKSYVKKARNELEISLCKSSEALEFKALYDETMRRNQAEQFYFFDENYFKKLFEFKESLVVKASFEGKNLAFASFFVGKDFGYYHLSANSSEKKANLALLDYFFEFCSKNGISFALLGGGLKDDDSLFYYKQRFSKLWAEFNVGGIVFNEAVYNEFCQPSHSTNFLAYRYGKSLRLNDINEGGGGRLLLNSLTPFNSLSFQKVLYA